MGRADRIEGGETLTSKRPVTAIPTTQFFKLPRGPGQPTKLTPKTKEALFQALLGGCSIKDACLYAEISVSTYEKWMKQAEKDMEARKDTQYVQFFKESMRVRDQAKPRLEMILAKAAEGDPRIALAILERRYPKEWGRREYIESKQEVNGHLNIDQGETARRIIEDPEAARLACELTERIGYGKANAGGVRDVRKPGPVGTGEASCAPEP
jgi:hypothetical protein